MNRLLALLALVLLLGTGNAFGDDWGPWENAGTLPKSAGEEQPVYHPLKAGVRFFQRFISPVDGPRCPMVPTCSAYALQALDRHGPLLGTMMTVDRLLHESDPREHRHPVVTGDRLRYADPLENNDFWFTDR